MEATNILVVGTKGSVIAFRRDTGRQLWSIHLKGSDFVSVMADAKFVYAHAGGELFCLDLFSGNGVWSDALKGFGYGTASLALPDVAGGRDAVYQKKRSDDAADTSTHAPTSG